MPLPPTPSGLPFGAVMATGAASALTGLVALPALRSPLLATAIVIALGVTGKGIAGLARVRGLRPRFGFGHFTVPVGLAVIALGLTAGDAPGVTVVIAVWLTWATTALLLVVVVGPVAADRPGLRAVNGAWYIAPAALLADAAGAGTLRPLCGPEWAAALDVMARACVWAGTAGYAALLIVGAVRIQRHGLHGAPRVAWWIVVGCGGLAADVLGSLAGTLSEGTLAFTAVACWAIATVVLVPVTVGSVVFLAGVRSLRGRPAWPPAFSSGVYALGTAQVGILFPSLPVAPLAAVAAAETLVVWAATAALRVRGAVLARATIPR
ncbi:hypothetical protein GH740_12165 [Microbacterium sp. SYP-A9085]|uniref:hypothetical protein n=1 Tax=Microbacterium sp. SYP-A9085 TaxID=2664454 RepID=UPI00129B9ACE|nr:hypothetical protein [Microbacterium sp. SYP-A9085]MRH30059.1 hypothetical protein [Microbacterium sp. SYP-A9085]